MLGLNSANKIDAIYAALAFRSYGWSPDVAEQLHPK